MVREYLRFSSEEQFKDWARKNAFKYGPEAIQEIEELILHEKAHFGTAKLLGYNPYYQVYAYFCDAKRDPNDSLVQFYSVNYDGKRPTNSDLIKILLAPQDPSADDLAIVERCRKVMK